MNIVQTDIEDSKVLDLFAGSGSLGLEAISRGARSVDFVEQSRVCVETIRKNIKTLGVIEQCTIHVRDVSRFVAKLGSDVYDIAFADPPYDTPYGAVLIETFRARPFAKILGVEHRAANSLPGDRTTVYGDVALTFCFAP